MGFIFLGIVLKLDPVFCDVFIKRNNARFEHRFSNSLVTVKNATEGPFDTNIRVEYANERQNTFAEYDLDSWYTGFVPVVLVISLLMATHFSSMKKRLLSLLVGILLTEIFIFMVLYNRIYILKVKAQVVLGDFENTFVDKLMIFFHNNLFVYGWICFVLPVFAWFIVAFHNKVNKFGKIQYGNHLAHTHSSSGTSARQK